MRNVPIFAIILFCFPFSTIGQASGPLSYSGVSSITIQNKSFTSAAAAACIYLSNCSNVKIQNCTFTDINTMIGVQLQSCTNIEIVSCTFKSFRGGIYAVNSSGINVHCNSFETIIGPKPRGQIVQFNNVTGTGNRINYNLSEHVLGNGDPEDLINCYASSGTAADPLQIIGNHLRGGGPSTSGGGIMIGDNGGHDFLVADNILVDPGQYGIAAPSGYNITIKNNKVFGKQQSFTNVGIYVGLQSEITAGFACVANTILIQNNLVNWTNKNGIKNGFYNCPCCSGITSSGNNFNSSAITASILPAAFPSGVCPATSLPLDWACLNVKSTKQGVLVYWETLNEINTSHFQIQRSDDGISYYSIGTIQAKGNNGAKTSYEFYDHAPLMDFHYYRIYYQDYDGLEGYSESINISLQAVSICVFPNPSSGNFYCYSNSETPYFIELYDQNGKKILSKKMEGSPKQILSEAMLPAGVYLLKIQTTESTSSSLLIQTE